jgi:hypothetical protein
VALRFFEIFGKTTAQRLRGARDYFGLSGPSQMSNHGFSAKTATGKLITDML